MKSVLKKIVVLTILCSALPLCAMERVKKIVGQLQGKPEYTKDIFDAAEQGNAAGVVYWLDKGVDVNSIGYNSVGNKKGTPLMHAIESGNIATITVLLDRGAAINAQDEEGSTALAWEVGKSYSRVPSLPIVQLLLDRGADTELKDRFGVTALERAVRYNRESIVRLLLDRGAHLEAADKQGKTALMIAAWGGLVTMVSLLLDRQANIEAKDTLGRTALIWAMLSASGLKVISLLLARGANIEAKDKDGNTPLLWMAGGEYKEHVAGVELLLNRGASMLARNVDGQTPLMRAVDKWRSKIISLLLRKEVHVDKGLAQIILDKALDQGDSEVLQALVATPFTTLDLNRIVDGGETLLIQNIVKGNVFAVDFLIKNGANPYHKDFAGLDAFAYARKDEKMLALLQKTKFSAPIEQVEEVETDTQKAMRRLGQIDRALRPQERVHARPSKSKARGFSLWTPSTPTEVHYKKFKKDIEAQYGKESKHGNKKQELLGNPIVKECMAKEQAAYKQGNYVFYRSEPGRYRVYEYFLQELYNLVNLVPERYSFIFTRYFKDVAKEQTINQYIDTKQWQAHKMDPAKNVLLSANIALFGNVHNEGSCTWDYFLKNFEATGGVQLEGMFERIFDKYGFDKAYIEELLELDAGLPKQTASLQQIIIPKEIVDDVVMFATHGYCFPWPEMVDSSCWDPQAVSVEPIATLGEKPKEKLGRHTCISSIIDKYRAGKINIDDAFQVRILMNAVYGGNPKSGIKFNLYTALAEPRLDAFKKAVVKITDKMFSEWLKQQLQSKDVQAEIADEPLGGVLKHLGKGKRQEKVKAKL